MEEVVVVTRLNPLLSEAVFSISRQGNRGAPGPQPS